MAKNIRETLLGTLEHGQEIMENIRVLRNVSGDKIPTGSVTRPAEAIHRRELKLVVQSVMDTGKQAKIFRLVSEDGYLPPFEAGQYINLFTSRYSRDCAMSPFCR